MLNWFKRFFSNSQSPVTRVATDTSPQGVYTQLRNNALTVDRSKLAAGGPALDGQAWGVILDQGYGKATVTLFSLIDGTTSLYISSGGGVIGGQQHESVRQATAEFIAEANRSRGLLKPCTEYPVPAAGQAIFYVFTDEGMLTGGAPIDELGHRRHPLANLFHAGDGVMTQLRLISQGK